MKNTKQTPPPNFYLKPAFPIKLTLHFNAIFICDLHFILSNVCPTSKHVVAIWAGVFPVVCKIIWAASLWAFCVFVRLKTSLSLNLSVVVEDRSEIVSARGFTFIVFTAESSLLIGRADIDAYVSFGLFVIFDLCVKLLLVLPPVDVSLVLVKILFVLLRDGGSSSSTDRAVFGNFLFILYDQLADGLFSLFLSISSMPWKPLIIIGSPRHVEFGGKSCDRNSICFLFSALKYKTRSRALLHHRMIFE